MWFGGDISDQPEPVIRELGAYTKDWGKSLMIFFNKELLLASRINVCMLTGIWHGKYD